MQVGNLSLRIVVRRALKSTTSGDGFATARHDPGLMGAESMLRAVPATASGPRTFRRLIGGPQQVFAPRTVLPDGSPSSPGSMTVPFEQRSAPPTMFPLNSRVLALRMAEPPMRFLSASRNELLLIRSEPDIRFPSQSKNSSLFGSPNHVTSEETLLTLIEPLTEFPQNVGWALGAPPLILTLPLMWAVSMSQSTGS
jgi:hypothetical protein